MNILETIVFGFYFGIGVIFGVTIFQLIVFSLKEIYIRYIIKKYHGKKQTPKKPKEMEFGKFND